MKHISLYVSILITLVSCRAVEFNSSENVNVLVDLGTPGASLVIWSPAGNILAITEFGSKDFSKLYLYNLESKELELLEETTEFGGRIWTETWSRDGTKLIFQSAGSAFKPGIWIVDFANPGEPKYMGSEIGAAWSATGLLALVQVTLVPAGDNIVSFTIRNPDTEVETLIFSSAGIILSGLSWSRDGTKLVFSMENRSTGSDMNINILNIQTGQVTQISSGENNYLPTWSPQADVIAYYQITWMDNILTKSMHITNLDGSCTVQVEGIIGGLSPSWSPDGTKIAYISNGDVYVVDLIEVYGEDFLSEEFPCNIIE